MMHKLYLKVGEMVRTMPGMEPILYPVTAKVVAVDSHPFEYDMIEIEVQESDYKCWVPEKYLTRADAAAYRVRRDG